MSSSRPGVPQVRNPTLPSQTTPEQRYWRGFTTPQLVKENHAINHIHFNPAAPHDFAVTSSTRVQVFSAKTRQVTKTYSRFKDTVLSGEFRYDGKLLVALDALGLVLIYDAVLTKNLLVSLQPLQNPLHVARFHPSVGNQLVTALDDRVVRLYDILQTTAGPVFQTAALAHGDYIRSAAFIQPSLLATGCYDGVVRLIDTRSGAVASLFAHDGPVEDVLSILPTTIVSAAGPQVKVWDLARGAAVHTLDNFSKTVTTLHNTGDRGVLAGSLDGHVKIFDLASLDWLVKFGWKFSGGVLACGVLPAPSHKHFVTGLSSGLLLIRTRKLEPKVAQGVKQTGKPRAYTRMMRGADYMGEEEHRAIQTAAAPSKKLKQFEKHLNAFRWADALDSAFATGLPKEQTVTVLSELKKRGKIRILLYGRDEILLLPLLQWFIKNLEDVRSINLVCDFVGVILEMYGPLIAKSVVLEEIFGSLLKRIDVEVRKCKEAKEIEGMLEFLSV
jgi:U3 small nucleolar RNA-associated protein 15